MTKRDTTEIHLRPTDRVDLVFEVNGEEVALTTHPMARLLDVLRDNLGMTGTKEGCGEGECGACAVLLNGDLVNSCLVPAAQAHGASIITIEGLADGETLHPIQQAFVEEGGAQCGLCTPGMILATLALLHREPYPTEEDIREALAGNLCRCTGYSAIVNAVRRAAAHLRQEGALAPEVNGNGERAS